MRSCQGEAVEMSFIVQLTLRVACLDRLNEFLQWKKVFIVRHKLIYNTNSSLDDRNHQILLWLLMQLD